MKKNIIYLLAFVAFAFAACNPLKDTINEVEGTNAYTKSLSLTLTTTDYALLPATNYAAKGAYFLNTADANAAIPTILNAKFAQLDNGSVAYITYNALPAQIVAADSVFANISYTVSSDDYSATNGTTFKNFSAAKVLEFLATKYPSATANQLAVLNYVYYESGTTTSAGLAATDSFLFLNGAWTKIYQISVAQYTAVGKGSYLNFASTDEANLVGYFNGFLKSDPNVAGTAKAGDIRYISYKFYNSSSKVTSQRVKTLVYDGSNWAYKSTPATLTFLKKNNTWAADPTVYYTLAAADYTTISTSTVGNTTNRANLGQYKNFNQSSGAATGWTDAEIQAGLLLILNAKYPAAAVDATVDYKITYYVYTGSYAYLTMTFTKTDAGFVFKSKP